MTVRFIRCSESGSFYVIFTYRLKTRVIVKLSDKRFQLTL